MKKVTIIEIIQSMSKFFITIPIIVYKAKVLIVTDIFASGIIFWFRKIILDTTELECLMKNKPIVLVA